MSGVTSVPEMESFFARDRRGDFPVFGRCARLHPVLTGNPGTRRDVPQFCRRRDECVRPCTSIVGHHRASPGKFSGAAEFVQHALP